MTYYYHMPIFNRSDAKGRYFIFGDHGHKYYYKPRNQISMKTAYLKALKQGMAIKISQRRRLYE
jgi:hypothetical protein